MKPARHIQIINLIQQYHIETQEELASRLNQMGFSVTQATVSRDIRALHLVKVSDGSERSYYAMPEASDKEQSKKYERVLRDAYISAEAAGNILVIKTASGMAMAAAAALDELNLEQIVGCIAGDNTIMCAIRTPEEAVAVRDQIKKMMEG